MHNSTRFSVFQAYLAKIPKVYKTPWGSVLVQRLHGGDFTGDIIIPLFILPFRDFVNPKWLHCRKQAVIKRHNFIPFVVKSVVKIQGCFHCPTK